MRILISNDDGIQAHGINALANALSKEHDVYVIAPNSERSAAGHSLTLHMPLRVEEVRPTFHAKRAWSISGTPGDCIKIGINAILSEEEKPDIIISGINHGPNLGADILYSGTVSAALEGAVQGYPSIAVSIFGNGHKPEEFTYAANFVAKFLPRVKDLTFPKKTILNINVPSVPDSEIKGVLATKIGSRMYTDTYEKRFDPRQKAYYWMAGEMITRKENDNSDISAVLNNYVSITPITFESTHESTRVELEKAFCLNTVGEWI